MVSLQKFGNSAVKFGFEDNSLYLNNGEITVPLNSLMLVTDDSELATFKKLNGDPFISVKYSDLGMDKDELEQWYKDNMVGGTGGSSSGITPSDVQDMIDDSIAELDLDDKEQVIAIALTELKNDKADTSAVTEAIDAAVSGKVDTSTYNTYTAATDATLATKADKNEIPSVSGYADSVEYNSTTKYVNFYHGGTGGTVVYSFNAAPFVIDGMVQDVVISGGSLVISFNTDAGKQDISIPLTEIFDPSNYYDKTATDAAISAATSGKVDTSTYEAYTAATNARLTEDEEVSAAGMNALEEELANKLDTSAYTPTDLSEYWTSGETQSAINAAVSGKADTTAVTQEISAAVSGKVDSSSVVTAVTSASTDSQIPTAKAVYDAIPTGGTGGGKAISAGTNISVTTGETADTVSCTLPIEVVGTKGIQLIGLNNSCAGGQGNVVFGYECKTLRSNASNQVVFGVYNETYQNCEFACGKNNVCRHGSSDDDKTLFTVGNGAAWYNRHNAFEIRQNDDIYIRSGGTDIKLQDHLGSTPSSAITSGDTNSVAGGAVYSQLGGLKLLQITQADYDALVQGGTVDSSTLYIITNVVS